MDENPYISEITTRIVLTEKAPFWIDIVYTGDYSHGRFLVRVYACKDDLKGIVESKGVHTINKSSYNADVNFYIVCEGRDKGTLIHKTNCRRVKK